MGSCAEQAAAPEEHAPRRAALCAAEAPAPSAGRAKGKMISLAAQQPEKAVQA